MGLLVEGFEAHHFDFAKLEQGYLFLGPTRSMTFLGKLRRYVFGFLERGELATNTCGGSFSSGPAAWRLDRRLQVEL